MKYCFIISNARLDYFNINKIRSNLTSSVHFILIHSKHASHRISENFKGQMQTIFGVDSVDFETCRLILEKFLTSTSEASIVCTDEPFLTVAAMLREHFNLPGNRPYQYIPFNSKITMKQIVSAKGIRTPRFINLEIQSAQKNLIEYHQFLYNLFDGSYIVKPIDCGGCEFTAKITNEKDFIHWNKNTFNPAYQYTAEEFISGEMYHCDSFVVDNKVVFCEACQYLFPCLEFLSGKPVGSYPIKRDSHLFEKILGYNQRIIDALKPPNGGVHLEFIMDTDNEPVFIEIGARPPGKAVCLVYEKNYNANIYELTLLHELGIPLNIEIEKNLYHFWVVLSSFPGIVKELNPPSLKSQADWNWKVKVGEQISRYPVSINEGVSAEAIIYNSNYEELLEDISILKNHRPYLC